MATKYKAADGYWYIKYKSIDGKWRSKFCGKNATASDAETIRKQCDAQELNRRHSGAVRIVDADIYESLQYYRDNEIPKSRTGRPKSSKGIVNYQAIATQFIEWLKIHRCKTISDVSPGIVHGYIDYLIHDKKRSASNVSKVRQVLNNFFDWAISKNYTTINPAKDLPNPKRKKSIPRYFTSEELRRIFDEAKEPYSTIFKFLYLTGLRIGELGNLEWSDYIESQRHIIIRVKEGNKTKREEIVPLNDAAVHILEQQKETVQGQYVFYNSDGLKLRNNNIYNHLKIITGKNRLNIPDVSPHTFRHTCASHLAIAGVSLYIIKDILRHASIKETEIYAHLSKEAVATAIQKLSLH